MNPNKKSIQLRDGLWVTTPEDHELHSTDKELLLEIAHKTWLIIGDRVHTIHLNKDKDVPEKIHSVNIVLYKKRRQPQEEEKE
jgi:hypothetical protein